MYRDWRGVVYPEKLPERRWFEHYATLFYTVELNTTFYCRALRHGGHDLLADHPWDLTTDWTYVRFHGPQALTTKYWGLYGPSRLRQPAARLGAWIRDGLDVVRLLQQRPRGPRRD